jgi:dephospho-CoA kinase
VQASAKPGFRPDVYTVVLTGGIASGKTAVSDCFSRLGVPVIDTDRIAHEVVEPGQPALQQIARTFGADFLDDEGRLKRRKMRQTIFENPAAKARLEGILHPVIAASALRLVTAVTFPYCLLVIPLYTESARWQWIDRVLVVDVAESIQIERVMARDGISRGEAEAILAAQADRQARLQLADDVIDNSGLPEDLDPQVEALHQKYLALATHSP